MKLVNKHMINSINKPSKWIKHLTFTWQHSILVGKLISEVVIVRRINVISNDNVSGRIYTWKFFFIICIILG